MKTTAWKLGGVAAIILGLAGCGTVPSTPKAGYKATDGAPKSVLWVGNSFFYYNNSMHGHVGNLLSAAKVTGVRQTSATISGSGINWHDVSAHFKPGGVDSYSFLPGNVVKFNTLDRPFDVVMMMDCSQCPIHPQLQPVFYEYAKKHSDTVRSYGAEPALFASWAYQDAPEMTQQLLTEYVKAGKANNAQVIPAGLAFANSIKIKPDLNLYVADKRHPSLAGTYLAANVVLASLFKQNPVGNTYTAGLPAETAKHLQQVAWDTVQAFKP
jgi:hypothetical protein